MGNRRHVEALLQFRRHDHGVAANRGARVVRNIKHDDRIGEIRNAGILIRKIGELRIPRHLHVEVPPQAQRQVVRIGGGVPGEGELVLKPSKANINMPAMTPERKVSPMRVNLLFFMV